MPNHLNAPTVYGSLHFLWNNTCSASDEQPQFTSIATVVPAGMFTVALPISPGGIGVGHVAFDRLFQLVRLSQGANIYNIFLLSQLSLNLLGSIPYLVFKKSENVVAHFGEQEQI